jgi:predicted RND superfamily exporter protein
MATLVKIGTQLSLNKTRTCAFQTANSLRNASSKSPKDNPIRKFNQQQKKGGFWKKFDDFFTVKEEKHMSHISSKERNRTTMMYGASAVIVTVVLFLSFEDIWLICFSSLTVKKSSNFFQNPPFFCC